MAAQRPAAATADQSGAMHLLSPAVVGTWTSHRNADASRTTLLVLWRGSPGWFSPGDRGSGVGGGGYDGYWLTARGLTFTVLFDFARRTARILEKDISLADTNVVLIDFADRPIGAALAGYHWIDVPRLDPAVADPVPAIIQRTPFLFDYLQCDVRLTTAGLDALRVELCNQVRPVR